jgi:hypothetical protein
MNSAIDASVAAKPPAPPAAPQQPAPPAPPAAPLQPAAAPGPLPPPLPPIQPAAAAAAAPAPQMPQLQMPQLQMPQMPGASATTAALGAWASSLPDLFTSTSFVSQLAFTLLLLLVFAILLRVGSAIMVAAFAARDNPVLVAPMVEAKTMILIPQDPSLPGAVLIPRSRNEDQGIEFTWSVWIYVDNLEYGAGKYRCVFYKGNDYAIDRHSAQTQQGLNFPNNAPGLYIAPNTNQLVIIMNTYEMINEQITINSLPLRKWVNVVLCCKGNIFDVYVNGAIAKSHRLQGVPKQNYGDVYVAPNGGFDGYISQLRYFNSAISPTQIASLAAQGPSTSFLGNPALALKNPDYMSLRWYF